MAKTATAQLFDLQADDLEGAVRVAKAFKAEGRLTGDVVSVLARMQGDSRELLKRIVEIGVDRPQRAAAIRPV